MGFVDGGYFARATIWSSVETISEQFDGLWAGSTHDEGAKDSCAEPAEGQEENFHCV